MIVSIPTNLKHKLLNKFRHLFCVNPRDVISQVIEYYFADVVRKRREVRHLFHDRFSVSEALQKMCYAQNYYKERAYDTFLLVIIGGT